MLIFRKFRWKKKVSWLVISDSIRFESNIFTKYYAVKILISDCSVDIERRRQEHLKITILLHDLKIFLRGEIALLVVKEYYPSMFQPCYSTSNRDSSNLIFLKFLSRCSAFIDSFDISIYTYIYHWFLEEKSILKLPTISKASLLCRNYGYTINE